MEWGWLGMAIPLLGLVGTTFYSIVQDSKGWKKVQSKIGENRRSSLEEQHEDIKDAIKVRTEGIEKAIVDKTSNIYSKVDNIDKIMNRNEARYENLNLDQKEVRNNVNKLVNSWEALIKENQELKELVLKLEYENQKLKQKTKVKNQREDEWDREL